MNRVVLHIFLPLFFLLPKKLCHITQEESWKKIILVRQNQDHQNCELWNYPYKLAERTAIENLGDSFFLPLFGLGAKKIIFPPTMKSTPSLGLRTMVHHQHQTQRYRVSCQPTSVFDTMLTSMRTPATEASIGKLINCIAIQLHIKINSSYEHDRQLWCRNHLRRRRYPY